MSKQLRINIIGMQSTISALEAERDQSLSHAHSTASVRLCRFVSADVAVCYFVCF